MSLRMPGRIEIDRASAAAGLEPVEHEILGEIASSLGHAGRKAEDALARLSAEEPGLEAEARERLLRAVAATVHAYFVQRELCGFRKHQDVIAALAIPEDVLNGLGARPRP